MSCPTTIAALAGVACGSLLPVPVEVAAGVSLAAWPGVAAGWLCRSTRAVTLSLGLGFVALGALAGRIGVMQALEPPLRALFDRQVTAGDRSDPLVVEGRLRRDAVPTEYGASLSLWVEQARVDGQSVSADGGMTLTVGGALVGDRIAEWRARRRVSLPVTLRRPARFLNPGLPDQERRFAQRGSVLRGSVKSALLIDVVANGSTAAEMAAGARAAIRRVVARSVGDFSPRSAGIVSAILIGDRAGLDGETRRRLQEAGTYHVIAISGGNIAILAGLVLGICQLLGLASRLSSLMTALALLAYAYMVGSEASVVRATLGAVTYLVARASDQRTPPINSLALVAAVMLTATPLTIFNAGFALTFGATLGILIGVPRLTGYVRAGLVRWTGRDPVWIRPPLTLLAATICAEAALLPIAAYTFSRVSLAGVVLNFAAIPLMTVAQIAGLAVVGLTPVDPRLATAAGFVAHLASSGLVESTRFLDLAPWLTWRVPAPAVGALAIYYGAWTIWFCRPRHPSARLAASGVIVGSLLWVLAAPAPALFWRARAEGRFGVLGGRTAGSLRVTVFDVGQADAVLVQFPDHTSLLVDTAGSVGSPFDIGSRILAPAIWASGVRRLDYLALTHGDPDHIGGALAVLRDFRPHEVWEGVPVPPLEAMQAIGQAAASQGTAWRTLQAGDRLRVGGVDVRIWHPPPPDWERQQVRNDDSLVIELQIGRVSIVLPGDIGRAIEPVLARHVEPATIRVVKVPHHGSRGSSSAAFVTVLQPDVALVSAGRANRFGHPAPEVVRRYEDAGATIFRTDRDGAIQLDTDGSRLRITTMTGRKLTLRGTGN